MLLHCFAGCDPKDVAAALDLTLAGLFAEPPTPRVKSTVTARYSYVDEAGDLLFTVERHEPGFAPGERKTFRQVPASGKRGKGAMAGVRLVLYRLPDVVEAIAAGRQVYVVEGEKDADRLAALGIPATTMPMGAGKWRTEYTEALRGAFVTVVADNDRPGRPHARTVAAALDGVAASVELMRTPHGKDISDYLDAGGHPGELVPLEDDAPDAPDAAPAHMYDDDFDPYDERAGYTAIDLAPYLDGTYEPPVPTIFARTDGVSLLYPGRTHVFGGEPESGKTWATLVACAAELQQGRPVVFMDFEDGPEGVVERLVDLGVPPSAIGDLFRYLRPDKPFDAAGQAQLAPLLDQARLVVLDGVTEAMNLHRLDPKADIDVATFYRVLARWIAQRGPAVVCIDHVVKDTDSRGRWVTGSQHKIAGISGAAFAFEPVQAMGRGMRGYARVLVTKDRPGQVRRHALPIAGSRGHLADLVVDSRSGPLDAQLVAPEAAADFRPTVAMRKVCDELAKAGRPLTQRSLTDRVPVKAATVRHAIELLVDEGYVVVESGPNRSLLHSLAKPFGETEEGTG